MNTTDFNDTICAIATPAGNGAIAVIRIAGADAIRIVDEIFAGKGNALAKARGNNAKELQQENPLAKARGNDANELQQENPLAKARGNNAKELQQENPLAKARGNDANEIQQSNSLDKARGNDANELQQEHSLAKASGNTIRFGVITDQGKIVDEVLVSIFKAPHSYTGEDIIEISCHGSAYIQQRILLLLVKKGARLAKPGEFTQRAFLNGKMDLAQAEAVADLIKSSSDASHRIAMDQMRGGFSDEISGLRNRLLQFISLIELELDFSEEDVEFADRTHLRSLLTDIIQKLQSLIISFQSGNVIKDGIPVVIAGLPNAGKSTLLNVFLNEERAIVSELPGTTRDVIEDEVHIEGFLFRFIDTAGLRHTDDKIEMIGIRKAYEKLKLARIILLICDINQEVEEIAGEIKVLGEEIQQKIIIVLNKTDLHEPGAAAKKALVLSEQSGLVSIPISAKKGYEIDFLKKALVNRVRNELNSESNVVVSNARHFEALSHASEASERALKGLKEKLPTDLIAQDIREILHYLGEITGEITNDEILGNIFANFCIGK
jgi:tRNA modification GTPase